MWRWAWWTVGDELLVWVVIWVFVVASVLFGVLERMVSASGIVI